MSYHFDPYDNSLVIDGFERGIADSPFSGIANMRNVNVVSVPGEASVGFATTLNSPPSFSTGTITSVNAGTDTITFSGASGLLSFTAVVFAGTVPTGITAGTVYWVEVLTPTTLKVYTDYQLTSLVDITSTTTGATFTGFTMSVPKYFAYDPTSGVYFMLDALGQVWTNGSGSGDWTYFGNNGGSGNKNGNGLVIYIGSDGVRWLFVFRNSCIDYIKLVATPVWVYGWNPSTGASGSYTTLKTSNGTNNPHFAMVAPDNRVYYGDANWVGRWYQTSATIAFDPTNTATFTFDTTQLLPTTDRVNCLSFLGTNLMIGGQLNVIYPWDRFDTHFSYPLLLPEYNVARMVTVNTNTFIFMGGRGRIYYTNGTNVQLYKKIPDHISGTIEPYFTWGDACSVKNQVYFGVKATTNGGTAIPQYGGVWALNLDNGALRLVNKLSYDTYAGYATALTPIFNTTTPTGTGLYIGWDDGASGYGIDITSSSPYTNSVSTIDSDLIPIGTFNKPRDVTYLEYKTTKPLVSGESVLVKTRLIFNTSDTGYTTTLTDSTAGNFSNTAPINFKNAQWVQFQIVLNSTASSPSYTRLKEIRIAGVGPVSTSTPVVNSSLSNS